LIDLGDSRSPDAPAHDDRAIGRDEPQRDWSIPATADAWHSKRARRGEVDQANVRAGRERGGEGQLVGGQSRIDTSLPAAGFGLRRLSSLAGVFRHAGMKARAVPRLIVARQRRRAIFGDSGDIRAPSRPIGP
jgi:hypothetical protein